MVENFPTHYYPCGVQLKWKTSMVLSLALALALVPITAGSAQKVTPGSSCKVLNQ